MVGAERNVKSSPMSTYEVHTEARGPHWIAWITRDGAEKPHESVILVARTQQEAETRARAWADRPSN
jgi:hypothetical protein